MSATPRHPDAAAPSSAGRPYLRSMRRWWKRDPYFGAYMVREFTSLAVLLYAIVLTAGAVALSRGPEAWAEFADALRSPWSIALHLALLWALWLHGKTWFEILPKTIPYVYAKGERVPPVTITRFGWAAALLASAVVLGAVIVGGLLA